MDYNKLLLTDIKFEPVKDRIAINNFSNILLTNIKLEDLNKKSRKYKPGYGGIKLRKQKGLWNRLEIAGGIPAEGGIPEDIMRETDIFNKAQHKMRQQCDLLKMAQKGADCENCVFYILGKCKKQKGPHLCNKYKSWKGFVKDYKQVKVIAPEKNKPSIKMHININILLDLFKLAESQGVKMAVDFEKWLSMRVIKARLMGIEV